MSKGKRGNARLPPESKSLEPTFDWSEHELVQEITELWQAYFPGFTVQDEGLFLRIAQVVGRWKEEGFRRRVNFQPVAALAKRITSAVPELMDELQREAAYYQNAGVNTNEIHRLQAAAQRLVQAAQPFVAFARPQGQRDTVPWRQAAQDLDAVISMIAPSATQEDRLEFITDVLSIVDDSITYDSVAHATRPKGRKAQEPLPNH